MENKTKEAPAEVPQKKPAGPGPQWQEIGDCLVWDIAGTGSGCIVRWDGGGCFVPNCDIHEGRLIKR